MISIGNNDTRSGMFCAKSGDFAQRGAELLSIGYHNNEWGVFPLRKGVYLDLNAGAYLVFLGKKLETSPYYERVQLIDPIDLDD